LPPRFGFFSSTECSLLDQLCDQGKRIEELSRIEHDLIKEVHPQVNEIKDEMEEMIAVVKESSQTPPPAFQKEALVHQAARRLSGNLRG
jgi:hypothetical protein